MAAENLNWKAQSDKDWIKLKKNSSDIGATSISGVGDTSIIIETEPATSYDTNNLNGVVTVSCTDCGTIKNKTINVTRCAGTTCSCADLTLNPQNISWEYNNSDNYDSKPLSISITPGKESCIELSEWKFTDGTYFEFNESNYTVRPKSGFNDGNEITDRLVLYYKSNGQSICNKAVSLTKGKKPVTCNCSDLVISRRTIWWHVGDTTPVSILLTTNNSCANLNSVNISGVEWFQYSYTPGSNEILVWPRNNTDSVSEKLKIEYLSGSLQCSQTVSLETKSYCTCLDLTLSPTSITWDYEESDSYREQTIDYNILPSSVGCIKVTDWTLNDGRFFEIDQSNRTVRPKEGYNNGTERVDYINVWYEVNNGSSCGSLPVKLTKKAKQNECTCGVLKVESNYAQYYNNVASWELGDTSKIYLRIVAPDVCVDMDSVEVIVPVMTKNNFYVEYTGGTFIWIQPKDSSAEADNEIFVEYKINGLDGIICTEKVELKIKKTVCNCNAVTSLSPTSYSWDYREDGEYEKVPFTYNLADSTCIVGGEDGLEFKVTEGGEFFGYDEPNKKIYVKGDNDGIEREGTFSILFKLDDGTQCHKDMTLKKGRCSCEQAMWFTNDVMWETGQACEHQKAYFDFNPSVNLNTLTIYGTGTSENNFSASYNPGDDFIEVWPNNNAESTLWDTITVSFRMTNGYSCNATFHAYIREYIPCDDCTDSFIITGDISENNKVTFQAGETGDTKVLYFEWATCIDPYSIYVSNGQFVTTTHYNGYSNMWITRNQAYRDMMFRENITIKFTLNSQECTKTIIVENI